MSELPQVKTLVEQIMRQYPPTRDDDFLLYAYVLNHYGYSRDITFWTVRYLVVNKMIPSMECVGRCRRKLQEMYFELQAVEPVAKGRAKQVPKYKRFASDMR